MPRIESFELRAVDLPFRKPFKHSAAERTSSSSVFLKCTTDSGSTGFGEALPRAYVSGESRDSAYEMLREQMLPQLLGREFDSLSELREFLYKCDGKAPSDWVDPTAPQTAAWCAVDLALLDAFARHFQEPVWLDERRALPDTMRFSPVVSSEVSLKTLILIRLGGFPQVKLKIEEDTPEKSLRRCRRILGRKCDIRADANMAWTPDEAIHAIGDLAQFGITSFEQPVAADDLEGLARLVAECPEADIMVDESLNDGASLQSLIDQRACTAVNVRISKCGGLIAAQRRCEVAIAAGLKVQVGCQVGESSLLSSALLKLLTAVQHVDYVEGCFGHLLLKEDPVTPLLQFRLKGLGPQIPDSAGFGTEIDSEILDRWTVRRDSIG